ncbi:MAG: hypothetical protein ACFCU3_05670 [Verrucomicrobiales bacterium]
MRSLNESPPLWLSFLILTVALVLAFWPTPNLDFIDYDDAPLITQNEMVQRGLSWEGVVYSFTEPQMNLWVPLTTLSHMLDVQIFGDWAGGHHLVNVVLHGATAFLFFLILRQSTRLAWLSLVASLLFAVHPLRVESVVWVAERKDVLSGFFYALALLLYVRWQASPSAGRYVAICAAALLGALSKPSMMTLPLAMLCLDFWPLRRLSLPGESGWLKSVAARLWEKTPFFALALANALINWVTWSNRPSGEFAQEFGFLDRLIYTLAGIGQWLKKTFWPADLSLFYPYPSDAPWLLAAVGLIIVLSMGCLIWWGRKRAPWLSFGCSWFLLIIFPVSGAVAISDHFAPDRYSYLPHLGLAVALVWSVAGLFKHLRWPTAVAGGAAALTVLALAVLTADLTGKWESPLTVWKHAAEVTSRNYVAHQQYGLALFQSGENEEGLKQLLLASQAEPRSPVPLGNLALAFARFGEIQEARRFLARAGVHLAERKLFFQELHAQALVHGKADLAEKLAEEARAWEELAPETNLSFGHFYYARGDWDLAVGPYQQALWRNPGDHEALQSLGALLLRVDRLEEGKAMLEKGVQHPALQDDPIAWRALALAYWMTEERERAEKIFERIVFELAPDDLSFRNDYATMLLDPTRPGSPDGAQALALFDSFMKEVVDPLHWYTLCRAYLVLDQTEAAREAASNGLQSIGSEQKYTQEKNFFERILADEL